jgi:hypothetical protein
VLWFEISRPIFFKPGITKRLTQGSKPSRKGRPNQPLVCKNRKGPAACGARGQIRSIANPDADQNKMRDFPLCDVI